MGTTGKPAHDIDLNTESFAEMMALYGLKSVSGVKYQLKKMEKLGLWKIHPIVPLSKLIAVEAILDGTTDYLVIDRISNDLRDKPDAPVSSLLNSLNVRNVERLQHLEMRIHIAREAEDMSNFAMGLQKQLQMVGLLLYYRETNTMPAANSFAAISKLTTQVILLESRKRFNLIKDYYFKLSEPAKLSIDDWPVHFGTIKAINRQKNVGYISSEGIPDLYFHLNDGHEELKDGNKVSFNLPITKKGSNGPEAVYVTPVK